MNNNLLTERVSRADIFETYYVVWKYDKEHEIESMLPTVFHLFLKFSLRIEL